MQPQDLAAIVAGLTCTFVDNGASGVIDVVLVIANAGVFS